MAKKTIAILKGGISSEREISLISANKVSQNIDRSKFQVVEYDTKTDLYKFIRDVQNSSIDVAFPVLHGTGGEDGTIQGLLELLGIPYVGCGVLCSALTIDKVKTKQILINYQIPTPKFSVYENIEAISLDEIKLPCVIKPINAGSSVGISIPENKQELTVGIKNAFLQSRHIMLEEYISGKEFTVGVIGMTQAPQVLPVIEIKPIISKFYDYKAKYQTNGSTHICPAQISLELKDKLQNFAVQIYKYLECYGMARIDFMVDSYDRPYFIEVNTIPGMTDVSLLPEAAKAAGISFPELLTKLITWSLNK